MPGVLALLLQRCGTFLRLGWRMTAERGGEALCERVLNAENAEYAGTAGVSRNNRRNGFLPAYRDNATGRIHASVYRDGSPAPIHVLEGVPEEWIHSRDAQGKVSRLKPSVKAGFIRNGEFFTREAAVRAVERADQ
jgi:hypothetical protein